MRGVLAGGTPGKAADVGAVRGLGAGGGSLPEEEAAAAGARILHRPRAGDGAGPEWWSGLPCGRSAARSPGRRATSRRPWSTASVLGGPGGERDDTGASTCCRTSTSTWSATATAARRPRRNRWVTSIPGANGIFHAIVVIDGLVRGTWRRGFEKDRVLVSVAEIDGFTERQRRGIAAAGRALRRVSPDARRSQVRLER